MTSKDNTRVQSNKTSMLNKQINNDTQNCSITGNITSTAYLIWAYLDITTELPMVHTTGSTEINTPNIIDEKKNEKASRETRRETCRR